MSVHDTLQYSGENGFMLIIGSKLLKKDPLMGPIRTHQLYSQL